MWLCAAVLLLWTGSGGCTEKTNTSDLIEYTPAVFYEKLNAGKMMLIFFERHGRLIPPTTHTIVMFQTFLRWITVFLSAPSLSNHLSVHGGV